MADLYKGKVPIVRSDLNQGFIRGAADPDHPPATGAVPRDFSVQPLEMRDSPAQMKLYAPSEWDSLYDAGEANEDSLEHIYLRGGQPAFEFLDQNGFSDCWCHSTAHAIMMDRAKQNLPPIRLNAVAVATLMGRTDGGWCGLSMKFARENGYPVIGTGPGQWPYQSRRGQDTPELRAGMKLHRDLEDWYDLAKAEYDQDLSQAQLATCLFNNMPSPSDYNRFGHSMLSLRLVRIEAGSWGLLTLNSWKGFGYFGLCVLAGMWPDGSCALRASTPSAA
jgi:hypothetical protein